MDTAVDYDDRALGLAARVSFAQGLLAHMFYQGSPHDVEVAYRASGFMLTEGWSRHGVARSVTGASPADRQKNNTCQVLYFIQ